MRTKAELIRNWLDKAELIPLSPIRTTMGVTENEKRNGRFYSSVHP